MVVDSPLMITSKVTPFSRPDQERGIIDPAILLDGWHWVFSSSDCFRLRSIFKKRTPGIICINMKKGWQVELGSEWICIGSLRGVITTESIIRLGASQCIQPPLIYSAPALAQSALLSKNQRTCVHKCWCKVCIPVSCINRGWGLWCVYHCIGRAAWLVCERSSAPRAAKSLFTRGKKGGRAAQCLLMMTNLAADVTLIILPVLTAHARDDDSGNVIQSIHWFYLCDLRCFLRLCHCLMTATFKALLSRSFLLASLDKRVVN